MAGGGRRLVVDDGEEATDGDWDNKLMVDDGKEAMICDGGELVVMLEAESWMDDCDECACGPKRRRKHTWPLTLYSFHTAALFLSRAIRRLS